MDFDVDILVGLNREELITISASLMHTAAMLKEIGDDEEIARIRKILKRINEALYKIGRKDMDVIE